MWFDSKAPRSPVTFKPGTRASNQVLPLSVRISHTPTPAVADASARPMTSTHTTGDKSCHAVRHG